MVQSHKHTHPLALCAYNPCLNYNSNTPQSQRAPGSQRKCLKPILFLKLHHCGPHKWNSKQVRLQNLIKLTSFTLPLFLNFIFVTCHSTPLLSKKILSQHLPSPFQQTFLHEETPRTYVFFLAGFCRKTWKRSYSSLSKWKDAPVSS